MTTYEEYIRESVLKKEEIDLFLDPQKPTWAQFDSELGYVLGNHMPRDGLDGSLTISTTQPNGARTAVVYSQRTCRINTYGNSFTECHQVSDHETWQEYLAAHLGEPIRNFGVGGYGLYQAFRRLLRTEVGPDGAEYIILFIWGDDHHRSLLRCRHVLTHRWWDHIGGRMLHGNFWANIEMDVDTGRFLENDNLLSTPESLYQMTDPGFMVEALRDDWMLQMSAYVAQHIRDLDKAGLNRLAEALGAEPISATDDREIRGQVAVLRDSYAFAATRHIIDEAIGFTDRYHKKLLVVLFWPEATRQLIESGTRYDEPVVQHLRSRGVRYFDMNLVHAADFRCFRLSLDEYLGRYLIGHYSPIGNHFLAFAIKDTVVDWLDPKPITYRVEGQALIDFEGYL